MDALATTKFDYDRIDESIRTRVRHYANVIRNYEQRTVDDIVMVGATLTYAKNDLDHGDFEEWVAAEFPHWSAQTSRRYMQVYERREQIQQRCCFSISVLYELLAPSVPDAAMSEAIEVHDAGGAISVDSAHEIAAKHKKPKPVKVAPEPQEDEPEEEWAEDDDAPEEPPAEAPAPQPDGYLGRLREVFDDVTDDEASIAEMMWHEWLTIRKESR